MWLRKLSHEFCTDSETSIEHSHFANKARRILLGSFVTLCHLISATINGKSLIKGNKLI